MTARRREKCSDERMMHLQTEETAAEGDAGDVASVQEETAAHPGATETAHLVATGPRHHAAQPLTAVIVIAETTALLRRAGHLDEGSTLAALHCTHLR